MKLSYDDPSFVEKEAERVRGLLKEKMSADKRTEIQHKLNILSSFMKPEDIKTKDEL